MSKVIFSALLVVCGVNVSLAGEGKSPAQSPVQAPPAPAAARADSGYRTYSYEPGTSYRSYSRAGSQRSRGFLDARTKALGQY